LAVGQGSAQGRAIGPATKRCIVLNLNLVDGQEGRIGINGKYIVTATDLARVTRAGEAALRLINLGTIDSFSAVADAIVGKTSISVVIALAQGHAALDGRVLLIDGGTPNEG